MKASPSLNPNKETFNRMLNAFNNSIPKNSEKVNINERNSKASKENSINLAKLNEITSTNTSPDDYSDLQIEAKPPKKAQEQKNTEPGNKRFHNLKYIKK